MRHDEKTTGWRNDVCDMTERHRDGGVMYAARHEDYGMAE